MKKGIIVHYGGEWFIKDREHSISELHRLHPDTPSEELVEGNESFYEIVDLWKQGWINTKKYAKLVILCKN